MLDLVKTFRRWRLRHYRIPDTLWQLALRGLPYAAALPIADRDRLREMALMFLARKNFEGAAGLEISDRIRVSIALQACILVLNLGLEYYEGWSSIVVYPGDFLVTREYSDETGVVHRYEDELSGESWHGGPVILSWHAVEEATCLAQNPVLHEFAHKLDMLQGEADGFPPLHPGMDSTAWTRAFRQAYDSFVHAIENGVPIGIDHYAAEDPAEFFAVLSESFFVEPEIVFTQFPLVYEQLRLFYRQDPRTILAG